MESTSSDRELERLILAARQGSEDALNELCTWLRPYLEESCRGRIAGALRTKVPESDIVQESLLGLSRTFDRFEGETKSDLVVWVRGILDNKSLELQRRFLGAEKRDVNRERRLNIEHSSQPGCLVPDSLLPALDRLVTAEEADRVKVLTSQLPPHYRQVIELRYLSELSFPEIANRMQRTEASVKNIFVRALEMLARGLNS